MRVVWAEASNNESSGGDDTHHCTLFLSFLVQWLCQTLFIVHTPSSTGRHPHMGCVRCLGCGGLASHAQCLFVCISFCFLCNGGPSSYGGGGQEVDPNYNMCAGSQDGPFHCKARVFFLFLFSCNSLSMTQGNEGCFYCSFFTTRK